MRKTTAGKTAILLVNLAFIILAGTAVMSAIPPQYTFAPVLQPIVGPSPYTITCTFTAANNGFYNIDNFYVSLGLYDSTDTLVGTISSSTPRTISRSENYSDAVTLIVATPPGTYTLKVIAHSEFAYGLIKFTIEEPVLITLT